MQINIPLQPSISNTMVPHLPLYIAMHVRHIIRLSGRPSKSVFLKSPLD